MCMKMPFALAAGAVGIAAVAALLRAQTPSAPVHTSVELPRPGAVVARSREIVTAPTARAATRVVVYVTGEVKRPGVYALDAASRIDSALRAASGPTAKADLVAVNLAEPLTDGERVFVPPKGAAYANDATSVTGYSATASGAPRHRHRGASPSGAAHRRGHRSHKRPPTAPIDVNAADATQLEELPGIGPSLAERIVAFRGLNGPFRSADELLDVAGMTDRRLDQISPYIVVR
jgi:competence protein ComEA